MIYVYEITTPLMVCVFATTHRWIMLTVSISFEVIRIYKVHCSYDAVNARFDAVYVLWNIVPKLWSPLWVLNAEITNNQTKLCILGLIFYLCLDAKCIIYDYL